MSAPTPSRSRRRRGLARRPIRRPASAPSRSRRAGGRSASARRARASRLRQDAVARMGRTLTDAAPAASSRVRSDAYAACRSAAVDGAELDPPIERVAQVVGAEADDDLAASRRPRLRDARVEALRFCRSRVCLTSRARRCDSASWRRRRRCGWCGPPRFMQVSRAPTWIATSRSQTAYCACRSAECSSVVVPGLKNILIGSRLLSRPMPTILPKVSVASFLLAGLPAREVEAVEDAQVVGVGDRLRPRGTGDRPRPACCRRRPPAPRRSIAEAGRRSRYAGSIASPGELPWHDLM